MQSPKIPQLLSSAIVLATLLSACAAPQTAAPAAPAAESAKPTEAPAAKPAASSEQVPCAAESADKEMPSGKLRMVIGTGGTGGVYYPYGGGLARILTEKMANTEVTAEVTGGSVDNLKLVNKKEADMGMTTIDSAFLAYEGKGPYKDVGKVSACTIATLYTSFVHVVALDSSGIKTIADMKGKRISVGSAGSSTEGIADRLLEVSGLNPKADITRDNLSVAESVAALKDQKIDGMFWIGGLPTSAVTDLVSTPNLKVKFLPTGDLVEKLRAKYGPVYNAFALPKSVYAGLEADVPGIGISNILVVNPKMSEKQVQTILKTIFDNLDEVKKIHPEAKNLALASAAVGSSIAYHPGAIAFYKEKGVWK